MRRRSEVRDDEIAAFYADVYSRVVGELTPVAGSRAVAEAATHEAFVRLINRWSKISSHDDPVAWLHRVAHDLVIERRPRDRVQLESEEALVAAPSIEALLGQARSRRRRATRWIAVAMGVVGVVAVAVLTSALRSDSPDPADPVSVFELPYFPEELAGDQALLVGILEFGPNDCPVLVRADGPTYLNFLEGTVSGSRGADGTRRLVGADDGIWGTEGRRVSLVGGSGVAGASGWTPRCAPDAPQLLVSGLGEGQ